MFRIGHRLHACRPLHLLPLVLASAWLVGCAALATPTLVPTPTASIANADVVHVLARQSSNSAWIFKVTVRHPDTGWDDYCDGWDVVVPVGDGRSEALVLKASAEDAYTCVLPQPHVDDQPLTSVQGGIFVPEGVTRLLVRAHDSLDGWGGRTVTLDLSLPSGPGFEAEPYGGKG